MIILTRQEAERVLGVSPSRGHSALEPTPLKDGTYLLPDSVLVDPAHADVKDFLSTKYSRGEPDPRLLWDFGTLEEPNQVEVDAYNAARLDWTEGNQRTEVA